MAKEQIEKATSEKAENIVKDKTCGIIMPIADSPGYRQGHWGDVLNILKQAIENADFRAELVSNDDAVGLIQDRIVTNIYHNEIVVCDVSSKNPNVMFELGMRLAFDKPAVIIKDDKTEYSFDIGGIEHITYPSSLRFADILEFKNKLSEKIKATLKRSRDEPDYSPFLKSFGRTLKPSSIPSIELPAFNYLSEAISDLKREMQSFRADFNEPIIRSGLDCKKPIFRMTAVPCENSYLLDDENEKIKFSTDSIIPS